MYIYIITFVISIVLIGFSRRVVKSQQWIILLFAMLVPCLLAGMRDKTIGTDVQGYLVQITEAAVSADGLKDFFNYQWWYSWRYLYVYSYEPGFTLAVFFSAKIFKSIYAVQFVIEALTIAPLCVANIKIINNKLNSPYLSLEKNGGAAKYIRSYSPLWICFLTYYMMFFNSSLNMMRQAIGVSFVFLGFSYMIERNRKLCIACLIIAALFHMSSILGVLVYLVYGFVEGDSKKAYRILKNTPSRYRNMIITILGATLFLFVANIAANILSAIGYSKYVGYISGNIHFLPNQVIVRLPVFLLFFLFWKEIKNERYTRFLFTMLWFDLIVSQFASVNSYSGRIGVFFSIFEMITLPFVYVKSKRKKWVLLYIICYLAIYWFYYIVISNTGQTIPYKFGS